MSMDHWDKFIAPVLASIEHRAYWTNYYAKEVVSAIDMLPGKPDFATRAEDVLKAAEEDLKWALASVQYARQLYTKKPIAT